MVTSLLRTVLIIALCVASGCGRSPERPTQPDGPFAKMLRELDDLAGNFENRKDVKCWTSFKRLETFVAGCQLAPATTHLKAEVVMDWIDQVWSAASDINSGGTQINAEAFQQATNRHFRWQSEEYLHRTLRAGDLTFLIPHQDFDNYLGTVEPIRVVQTLGRRLQQGNSTRLPLDSDAVASAVRLAAMLSTALLKESNRFASERNHAAIETDDVLSAAHHIAQNAALNDFDPSSGLARAAVPPNGADANQDMLADIRKKVEALKVFNTTYSRDVLGEEFNADLSRHEQEWARLPVRPDAAAIYKEDFLVALAKDLYITAAAEHPLSDPLTGLDMLQTILGNYPYATYFEGGVSLFPQNGDTKVWIEELEADALRDTGWHWQSLEQAVRDLAERDEQLPALDLYALEELSEFLSIYSVAIVRLAGNIARQEGATSVSTGDVRRARDIYEQLRRQFRASAPSLAGAPAVADAPKFADAAAARDTLRNEYIEEMFSDVTDAAGIDFRHETSERVRSFRFASQRDLEARLQQPASVYYFSQKRDRFPHRQDHPDSFPSLEIGIAGGGVAVADVDGDGRLDIYLVSGKQSQLWMNEGELRFHNATSEAGLTSADEGRGAYFVDYDNDGDQDLFVTHVYAPNRLFRNRGDGKFDDVTSEAGLPLLNDVISHSAVWFDVDNDGHLDVYVGNFGDWLSGELPLATNNSRHGQPNALYRNRGDGTFEDATETFRAGDTGWAHAVSHFDANNDGWQDLYLANDFGQDVVLLNESGQRFVVGTPDDLFGKFHHAMSVGFTDFNRDGIEDIYVSNIAMFSFVSKHIKPDHNVRVLASSRTVKNARMLENNLFLVSLDGAFIDQHNEYFQRSREGSGWAWDADFFDFDNDGLEDLYIVNGREPNLGYNMERNVLYRQFRGRFYDVSTGSGADFRSNARGAVHADLDNDGDLDIIVNNYEGRAVLLRNNLQRNHWVRLRLQGSSSNRDAVGAVVRLHASGKTQTRRVRGGSGFLSKEPFALHFGLGNHTEVDRIEITWPSGTEQTISHPTVDREHHVVEP